MSPDAVLFYHPPIKMHKLHEHYTNDFFLHDIFIYTRLNKMVSIVKHPQL